MSLTFAAVLIAVVSSRVARKQQRVEVRLEFNRQTFRLPDKVPAADAEEARNVMILLMKALGIIPAAAARQPGMTKPKADFLVTGPGDATLDVVNVKQNWREPMAVALGVSICKKCMLLFFGPGQACLHAVVVACALEESPLSHVDNFTYSIRHC